jgi:integrase
VKITTRDVLAFIEAQRQPRRGSNVVRIDDGEQGLSARTVKRRLSSVSGLFAFLVARGDVDSNPVPRGLSTRRVGRRGVPLIRAPQTLPRVLEPQEATALLAALRTHRDRAMVEAMLFGALRRCEVLGLRLQDLRLGEHRVFVTEGKGSHQRLVPVAPRFFTTVELSTLGFDAGRFPPTPPACYRATWQLPRTGLTSTSDDELTAKITYNRSRPVCWAHKTLRLVRLFVAGRLPEYRSSAASATLSD